MSNHYVIFQIKEGEAFQSLRQCSYEKLIADRRKAYIANYNQVYVGSMTDTDTPAKILQKILRHAPADFEGRPFEVGDVIAVKQGESQAAYYINDIEGTKILIALPHFFTTADDRPDEKETLNRGVERHDTTDMGSDTKSAETPPQARVIHGRASISDRVALFQAQMQHHSYETKAKHRATGMDR